MQQYQVAVLQQAKSQFYTIMIRNRNLYVFKKRTYVLAPELLQY